MRGNFKCICGFIGNPTHTRNCVSHKNEVLRVTDNIQHYIKEIYLSCYSVSSCVDVVVERENTALATGNIRKILDAYLDKLNIREGVGGKNNQKMKQKKIQATVKERYGVDNYGQLEGEGFKKLNKRPYNKLPMMTKLNEYRKEVEYHTGRSVNTLKKQNAIPETCYYTDKIFNDVVLDEVNPNDPLKRTVDHVVPITEAYLLDWPAEKTGSIDNIVFCLRCVNTLKHNTEAERFKTLLVPIIKERLNDEG